MTVKGKSFFKSSDARGFLFFLLLTSLVAVLIKLSKNYTKIYTVTIDIVNVPIDQTVKSITPKELAITTEVNGFSLMLNSFKSQEVPIDFISLDSISNNTLTLDTNRLSPVLKEVIGGGVSFTNFSAKNISVTVDKMFSKKVPVASNIIINYKGGYDASDVASVMPDSVMVVGPKGVLEEISSVRTMTKTLNDISNDVAVTLALDTISDYKDLAISNNTFEYKQKVAKFTEGSFMLPVTLKGAKDTEVKIFPREVNLFYVTSLEAYDAILPSDFEIEADFSKRTNNEEFLVLSVSRKPDNVRKVRLETKQIKFIVVN